MRYHGELEQNRTWTSVYSAMDKTLEIDHANEQQRLQPLMAYVPHQRGTPHYFLDDLNAFDIWLKTGKAYFYYKIDTCEKYNEDLDNSNN
jgi:hypothetical protein